MKRRIGIYAALGALLLSACSVKDHTVTPMNMSNTVISFGSAVDAVTKATEYTATDLTGSGFLVSAYNTTSSSDLFTNKAASYSSATSTFSAGSYWWPVTDKLSFIAVYPKTYTMTRSSNSYAMSVGTSSAAFAGTGDFIVASAPNVTLASTTGGIVPLVFNHPLNYVSSVRVALNATSANFSLKVKEVKIAAPSYGTYTVYASNGSSSWTRSSSSKSYTLSSTAKTISQTTFAALTTTGTMFVPTSDGKHQLTIKYDLLLNGTAYKSDEEKTISISLTSGCKSTVDLTYNVSQGTFSPTITLSAWGTGNNYEFNY